MLGPGFGGLLYIWGGYILPFVVPGAIKLLMALLEICVILDFEERDQNTQQEMEMKNESTSLISAEGKKNDVEIEAKPSSIKDFFLDYRVLVLSFPIWVAGSNQGFNNAVFGVFLNQYFSSSETKIANFFVLFGLSQALPILLTACLISKSLKKFLNSFATILGVLGYIIMLLTSFFESWRYDLLIALSGCLSYSAYSVGFVSTFAILGDLLTEGTSGDQETAIKTLVGCWNMIVYSTGRLFASFVTAGVVLDSFGFEVSIICQLVWTIFGAISSLLPFCLKI